MQNSNKTCRNARASHRLATLCGFLGAATLASPAVEAQVGATPETFFNLISNVEFQVGGSEATAEAVAAGDLNGDGRTDLIVVRDDAPPSLVVLLGVENGGYELAGTLPFAVSTNTSRPISVVLLDIAGDSALDILAIAPVQGVSIYVGNGDGTFSAEIPLGISFPDIPLLKPFGLEAADLDGDGWKDVVTTYPVQGENELEVRYGLPDGTFEAPVTFGPDLGADGVRIVDLNNDNQPDIVTEGGVYLENLGGRNFAPPASLPAFANRIAPRFADINGDGWLDFVALRGNNTVSVTLSTGLFSYAPPVFLAFPGTRQPDLFDIGDVDGDGTTDILTYEGPTNELLIFLGDGTGAFPTVIR